MNSEIMIELATSASVAVGLGVIANLLFSKKLEQEKIQEKKLEEIASSVSTKYNETKFRIVEAIANKIPKGANAEEFASSLAQNIQIRGDLFVNGTEDRDVSLEDLVSSYHQQALSQAKVQFWFSVLAATVGFAYILYAASNISYEHLSSYLNILPGAVIDAVAFLFFKQAEQTRERATALYDRLRSDNQMAKAKELVDSIEDIKIKSAVKAQIALHMAGLKTKEIDLPSFINEGNK